MKNMKGTLVLVGVQFGIVFLTPIFPGMATFWLGAQHALIPTVVFLLLQPSPSEKVAGGQIATGVAVTLLVEWVGQRLWGLFPLYPWLSLTEGVWGELLLLGVALMMWGRKEEEIIL